ncbi:hypothetical protein BDV98DRAFT_586666 [Pterulicium gracile]|uniref:Uncharacterized protein n=1 Tax=Pterulicium gracile TaxID=1884261 RepID=A0A5C3QC18_9AGAR|nr:hypothetical protein BDV98DRAFT_586666 [Pterula gracilis]
MTASSSPICEHFSPNLLHLLSLNHQRLSPCQAIPPNLLLIVEKKVSAAPRKTQIPVKPPTTLLIMKTCPQAESDTIAAAPGGQLNAPAAKKECRTNVPVEKSVPKPDLKSNSDKWHKEDPNKNGSREDASEVGPSDEGNQPTAADLNTERVGRSVCGGKQQTALPSDNDKAYLEPLAERTGGQDKDQACCSTGTINSGDKDVLPVQSHPTIFADWALLLLR